MYNNSDVKKLTEEQYYSIDQVRAFYNKEDVSDIWAKIIAFRNIFNYETDLRDINNNPYFITFTRNILNKSHQIELKLMRDLLNFQSLSQEQKDKILLARKIPALKAVNRFKEHKELNDDLYERIALLSIDSLPANLISLNSYSQSYNNNFFNTGINLDNIAKVNNYLLNDIDNLSATYRKNDNEEDEVEYQLKLVNTSDIQNHLSNLVLFLKDENVPYLIRAIILVYSIFYIKPFEYLNEESCALLAKSFLASSPLFSTSYLLDFESLCFSKSSSVLKKAKECEKTLDLTYFIDMTLPFFEKEEKTLNEIILQELVNNLIKENEESEENNNDYNVEETYALPFFPSNKSATASDIVIKLRELYPVLKEKQAHFYSTHCTIGLSYTISQFQKEENTVYETARTSMDELAKLGLYKKTKVNKKFVYQPVPKEDINK